ncbi:alpha/beta fold hydrolase [Geodermatophilus marinus]|uniref:alpha/beta fold hydrolase n=1 Tax=Geodermatophilus sp. LHW52908 TaxID=2303986 RepID=UPI0011C1249B|nr:alpha/beta fold hydrolase [Geodermatophilus sp. LHW52908]
MTVPTFDPSTAAGSPVGGRTVGEVLVAVAAQHPGTTAVSGPGVSLTFGELAARATAAADRLIGRLPSDGRPDAPVAVLATPSVGLVVAASGVVLSGRPLVILDPQLPAGRLQQIQEMAGAALCVVEERLAEQAATAGGFPAVTDLDDLIAPPASPGGGPGTRPAASRPDPEGPATIVFTSGSTGRPKGVVHTHAFLVAEAAITGRHAGLTAHDRFGLVLPPSFALGEHALLGALLNGIGVHVYDPRVLGLRGLPAWLAEQRVTALTMTPSLLRALSGAMPTGGRLEELRLVITAGEALQGRDVRTARERLGPVTVVNHLGSSETGQLTFGPIAPTDPVPDGPVPAGRVVEEKEIQVLGDDGAVLPQGEVGTMHVLGAHLGSYLGGGPDGPYGRAEDGRASFRTSDRGRYDEHGVLHQLGRADDAVKVNGYLVEPAEVETALRAAQGVADASVVAVRTDTRTHLVGYVAPSTDQRTPSPAQLRRELAARLPSWMVPAELVLLDELPRNERGKVDRAALPRPQRPDPVPPEGHWEQVVAGLFESVLHRTGVGRDETFTALGGDSLGVEELLTRLAEEHGVVLTSAHVAESPTVRQLAARVADHREGGGTTRSGVKPQRQHGSVVELRGTGSRPPVLCFAGAGAGGQAFLALAEALGADQPVYAFQPHGFEDWTLPDYSIGMAARRHLRRLRSIQPTGPYRLVGHSMGGLIALDVARRLTEDGETVASVTLVDTVLPQRLVDRAWRADVPADGSRPAVAPLPGDDKYGPPATRRELWRRRALALGAAVLPPSSGGRTEGMLELGVRVALMHGPRNWPGRAAVFVSHLNETSLVVWRQVMTGEATFTTLHGEHNSLLRQPFIQRIADSVAADV